MLSITIMSPMPGAVLTPDCPVSGTFMSAFRPKVEDRNFQRRTASTITVTATKNGTSYGPFLVTVNGTQWSANSAASPIPAGTGYTITASITDGTDVASNAIETVDIAATPPLQIITITPPPIPMLEIPRAKKAFAIEGKHDPAGADGLVGLPYQPLIVDSTTALPSGGTHHLSRVLFGAPVDNEITLGEVDKPNKKWKVKKVNVEQGQFVMVFLMQGNVQLGRNSTPLF